MIYWFKRYYTIDANLKSIASFSLFSPSFVSFFLWKKKILAVGVRAQVLINKAKKVKTHTTFDLIHIKLKSKVMQFFVLIYKIFRMFRRFEQLSSAICWQVITCSTCATPDAWWILIDLCAPFLHYALSHFHIMPFLIFTLCTFWGESLLQTSLT